MLTGSSYRSEMPSNVNVNCFACAFFWSPQDTDSWVDGGCLPAACQLLFVCSSSPHLGVTICDIQVTVRSLKAIISSPGREEVKWLVSSHNLNLFASVAELGPTFC